LEEVEVLRYGTMLIFLVVEDFCPGSGFEYCGNAIDGRFGGGLVFGHRGGSSKKMVLW
jgi:hypothetical protein